MTPPARLSAAIAVLDQILAGRPAEQALANWGRASRFAGSADRFAVRDLVYEALRCKRSFAALGGAMTGRGLILGLTRAQGIDPIGLFTGEGHAPAPISPTDEARTPSRLDVLDCPDWLAPKLEASLGNAFEATMLHLKHRAPVFLRVNLAKATLPAAIAALAEAGIAAEADPEIRTALLVTENARKISGSRAYLEGLVELQDRSSQAIVLQLPLRDGHKVLDYCAGGGGKTLAMANLVRAKFHAHDAFAQRMKDLPERARRAGAKITQPADPGAAGPYDLVLCDVPCSGSGSWRRDPMGKWALTSARLAQICQMQSEILDRAAQLIQPAGVLAYATCSILQEENEDQVASFVARQSGWVCTHALRLPVSEKGDGFFIAILKRQAG